jgi:hypothetical protein
MRSVQSGGIIDVRFQYAVKDDRAVGSWEEPRGNPRAEREDNQDEN